MTSTAAPFRCLWAPMAAVVVCAVTVYNPPTCGGCVELLEESGFPVEGHVPAAGLAAPVTAIASPGMERGDTVQPSVFARHGQ